MRQEMKKYIFIILAFIFTGYIYRFLYVEGNREYSQGGFADVLSANSGIPISSFGAAGIGCTYWIRLKKCIGMEIISTNLPIDISNQIDIVVKNFCGLVEEKYPKEKYIFHSGAMADEFDLGLSHAYASFFDCKNSRQATGEIRVYVNPSGTPTEKSEWIIYPKLTKIYPIEQGNEK